MKVALQDIYVGGRFRKDYGDLDELADDIKRNGQITPITLRPPTTEEIELGVRQPWVLLAGGRRYMAHLKAGFDAIEAFTREEMDKVQARIIELHENLKRKNLDWREEVALKEEIVELYRARYEGGDKKVTLVEIAKDFGWSVGNLSKDIQTAEAIKENPELAKSATKKGALRAAKVKNLGDLKEAQKKVQREAAVEIKLEDRMVQGEMEEWLLTVPPRSIDLVIPDLPYGIDYFKSGDKNWDAQSPRKSQLSNFDDTADATKLLYEDIVPKMVRVTRQTGWIVCFTSRDLYDHLVWLFSQTCGTHAAYRKRGTNDCEGRAESAFAHEACRFLKPEVPAWIWYRPNSRNNPRFPEYHAKNVYEVLCVVNMGKGLLTKPCDNVLMFDQIYFGERTHANQKPVELIREIVQRLTIEGDTVLDPCFGSGAHLAAAASVGREILGCEKNEALIEVSRGFVTKRLRKTTEAEKAKAAEFRAKRAEGDVDQAIYDMEDKEDA